MGLLASAFASAAVPNTSVSTVQSLLEIARQTGTEIIYSTDLVPPDLLADASRADRTALERVADALASHNLQLKPIGPRRYVVVRVPAMRPARTQADEALTEVAVFASRYAIEGRAISARRLLSSTDIQIIPGSHDDPLHALRSLPGLATNVSARPYIRGSLADDVLVRFDGIALLDPFHLKNFQSLISAIDPTAVERMEVYSGGFPVRYGTRSGGVIDITPPSRNQGFENGVTLSLLTVGGSTIGKSDRWPLEWLATARRSTTDLLLEPLGAGRGVPQLIDASGRLRWRIDERSDWAIGWLLLDDRIELGTLGDEEYATARYRDEYFWLSHTRALGEKWQSRSALALTSAERARAGDLRRPLVVIGQLDESRSFQRIELTSDWTYQGGEHSNASLGASVATSRSEFTYARSLNFSPSIAAAFGRPEIDNLNAAGAPKAVMYAGYGSLRHRWARVEGEFGLRLDGQTYDMGASNLQWSPRLNLRLDLSDHWRAYASIGRFTQAQRVEEWRAEEAQQLADPAQVSMHSILGLAHESPGATRWSLEFYRKRWTTVSPYFDSLLDPLALLPDLAADRVRLTPANSEASGIEMSVRAPLSKHLRGWASLTAARVADEFNNSDVTRSWDQPLALTAGLAWSGSTTDLSVMAGWHSGWPRTPVAVIRTGPPAAGLNIAARNAQRWNDYYGIDVRGSWTHPVSSGELSTFFEVTNATDQRNACCSGIRSPVAGEVLPQLEVTHWLPLVINVGVTFRWRTAH